MIDSGNERIGFESGSKGAMVSMRLHDSGGDEQTSVEGIVLRFQYKTRNSPDYPSGMKVV